MLCFTIAVDCGSPDEADPNGSVAVDATTFKNTATYSCNVGYWLDLTQGGSEVVVCQADGQWSDTAPSCLRKYEFLIRSQCFNSSYSLMYSC